ncbi:MAG: hypothetical protein V1672_02385 [Candidatus Diapherotrites archaeon]
MKKSGCDGLLVHPVIGKKKKGDFTTPVIIESYKLMSDNFYPKNKVVFSALSTFSRYGGPREAIFTALVRQNYGCSHFIVGRDHTGVSDFYDLHASHKIFDELQDIKIKPVKFDEIFYCSECKGPSSHNTCSHSPKSHFYVSGTKIRAMILAGKHPPVEAMRSEIASMIIEKHKKGEKIFVD